MRSNSVMPDFRHRQVEADNRAWVLGKVKCLAKNAALFFLGMLAPYVAAWALALAGASTLVGGQR